VSEANIEAVRQAFKALERREVTGLMDHVGLVRFGGEKVSVDIKLDEERALASVAS
jgi:hypothetical protein